MLLVQYFNLIFSSILQSSAHVRAANKIKNGVLKMTKQKITKKNDLKINAKTGWYNHNIHVSYKDSYEIGAYMGKKLYGYLPEEYSDNARWTNALSKGFVKKAVGHNGVKFIEGKLLELKINDDARLYTTAIHQNDSGDFLAIFDHEAGHKTISRIARSGDDIVPLQDCLTYDLIGATGEELVEVY